MRKMLPIMALFALLVGLMLVYTTRRNSEPDVLSNVPLAQPNVLRLAESLGCDPASDPFGCLEEESRQTYEDGGMPALLAELGDWKEYVKPDGLPCHGLMHALGKDLVAVKSVSGLVADSEQSSGVCANGFFHGVTEGLALSRSTTELRKDLADLCRSVTSLKKDCVHSAGHAFAMVNPDDAYGALSLCEDFSGDESVECGSGVFMTFGRGLPGYEEEAAAPWIRYSPAVAGELCFKVDKKYSTPCWFLLWMAYLSDPALGGADSYGQVCERIRIDGGTGPGEDFKNCYRGLAMLYLERGATTPETASAKCPPSGESRYWCVFGVGWAFMYDHYLIMGSESGYESVCARLPEFDLPACRAGENYVLEKGVGL